MVWTPKFQGTISQRNGTLVSVRSVSWSLHFLSSLRQCRRLSEPQVKMSRAEILLWLMMHSRILLGLSGTFANAPDTADFFDINASITKDPSDKIKTSADAYEACASAVVSFIAIGDRGTSTFVSSLLNSSTDDGASVVVSNDPLADEGASVVISINVSADDGGSVVVSIKDTADDGGSCVPGAAAACGSACPARPRRIEDRPPLRALPAKAVTLPRRWGRCSKASLGLFSKRGSMDMMQLPRSWVKSNSRRTNAQLCSFRAPASRVKSGLVALKVGWRWRPRRARNMLE